MESAVTGHLEPSYPAWKRIVFSCFVSYPLIVASLSLVFATMWAIFELQDWVNERIDEGDVPYLCKYLPNVLLALCISVYDDVYKKIACWLNNKGKWVQLIVATFKHFCKYIYVHVLSYKISKTLEWFRELSFSRLECGVHNRLHIYPLSGIFYFPWHRHLIKATNGF